MPAPAATPGATFVVTTDRCPQILCRLLGLVAQQGRMVARLDVVDTRRTLRVTLCVADIDARGAAIVAEKMRQMVRVRTVRLRGRPGVSARQPGADARVPECPHQPRGVA